MLSPNPLPPRGADRPLLRRLFSLTGVLPLGVFLLLHTALNASALRGDDAFARAVRAVHRIPLLGPMECLLVLAPLALHAAIGLWLVVTRTQFGERSPYPHAVRIAMRTTGVAAIAFLALHLPTLRFHARRVRLGGDELATLLVSNLSSTWHGVPWQGAAYLVGTACVTFHFVAGMWAFCVTAAGGASPRMRRVGAWGAAAVGAAMWMLLANIVVFRATGARLFGAAEKSAEPGGGGPCPPVDVPHGP